MITIKDIAKEAGVSVSTVSYVINDSGPVSKEKRDRINTLISKYGYVPNRVAKSLKQNKTRTIGIITDLAHTDISKEIIIGISNKCKKENYDLLLANQNGGYEDSLRALTSSHVEGIIYIDYKVEEAIKEFETELPIVYAYCYSKNLKKSCVVPNDRQGGYMATKHLIDKGHKSIGCITGCVDWKATNDRLQGYYDALTEYDINMNPTMIKVGDYSKKEINDKVILDLLSSENRPSAIFAFNDIIATSVYSVAKKLGLVIPDDIAVVGYDSRELSEYIQPTLTSISMPLSRMGEISVELLLDKIEGKGVNEYSITPLDCQIIERESS